MAHPDVVQQRLRKARRIKRLEVREAANSPEYAIRPRIQPFGVLGALLLCFGFLAFLNAVDKLVLQQEQAAVKSEFGELEMRGSIVR